MPLIHIQDIDDERISVYRDLLSAKASRRTGLFVVEGSFLVERLVDSSFETHSIFAAEGRVDSLPFQLEDRTVFVAPPKSVEAIVGYNFHRGVLACGYRPKARSIDEALHNLPETCTVLVCVGIQDPTNLGSILRSAAAFGISTVILGNQCSDPYSRRVVRVSMGAALKLTTVETDNIEDTLDRLHSDFDFERVATTLQDADVLEATPRAARVAILVGNEAHGLPDNIAQACEKRVTIPMQLGTDSLNAAVATGIVLHHFTRVAANTRS